MFFTPMQMLAVVIRANNAANQANSKLNEINRTLNAVGKSKEELQLDYQWERDRRRTREREQEETNSVICVVLAVISTILGLVLVVAYNGEEKTWHGEDSGAGFMLVYAAFFFLLAFFSFWGAIHYRGNDDEQPRQKASTDCVSKIKLKASSDHISYSKELAARVSKSVEQPKSIEETKCSKCGGRLNFKGKYADINLFKCSVCDMQVWK